MDLEASLKGVLFLFAAIAVFSLVETIIPLHRRTSGHWKHLVPNLSLTVTTFGANLLLNILILIGLVYLRSQGWGLFNAVEIDPLAALIAGIIVLDFAWYVTHVFMHHFPALWAYHKVHHTDRCVDVTTTVRQHPGENMIRFLFLAGFAFSAGVSIEAFAIYRIWSAVWGMFEHANISLPQWLDTTISLVSPSPNMHKVHHSRDVEFTNTNYSNLFSIWDRLFRTFTPAHLGREINYGIDDHDGPDHQTVGGVFASPYRVGSDGS